MENTQSGTCKEAKVSRILGSLDLVRKSIEGLAKVVDSFGISKTPTPEPGQGNKPAEVETTLKLLDSLPIRLSGLVDSINVETNRLKELL